MVGDDNEVVGGLGDVFLKDNEVFGGWWEECNERGRGRFEWVEDGKDGG